MMKKSFWYNSDQNGNLLKPRTGHGEYVVDIDNMLFAISGLSNCTVSTYRVFLQCTMCTLFSLMPLYLLWPCIRYNNKKGWVKGIFRDEGVDTGVYFRGNHGSRVWKSQKCEKMYFPHTPTSWDKYMFNRIPKLKFQGRSELVRLRGKTELFQKKFCIFVFSMTSQNIWDL